MDAKVEIIIDEAHYLFNDDANLAFLNQIARHQRHAGLRLVMLSQTLQEFYDEGVAEEIAGMCPIMVHHREPDLGDKTAAKAGLTGEQQYYIQTAEAGKESIGQGQGFSQALVRVDEHGDYPLTIRTSWEEKRVIDLDAHGRDPLDDVVDEKAPEIEQFEEFVYSHAMETELTEKYGLSPEQAEHILKGLNDAELLETVSVALDRTDKEPTVADGGIGTATDQHTSGTDQSNTECLSDETGTDQDKPSETSTESLDSDTESTPGVPSADSSSSDANAEGTSIWESEQTTNGHGSDSDD
jgi:hypothetical protein